MFTGIVETIGTVTSLTPHDDSASGGGGTSLTINVGDSSLLDDAKLGDSISINGACLTITSLPSPQTFKVGVAPETLRRTDLGALGTGSRVNLEAAVQAHGRMGGHIVQGHVDTVCRVAGKRGDGNAVVMRFAPRDAGTLRYVVEKGFVAVDGASLTVTAVAEAWFEVMLIAYTQEMIVLPRKEVGDEVNLEVDMMGKYAEKSVAAYFEGAEANGGGKMLERMVEKLVQEKLKGTIEVNVDLKKGDQDLAQ